MDSFALRRFAAEGLRSGLALDDLATWCVDFCEASGDARFCAVGAAIRALDDWWSEYDEGGGVPRDLADPIDDLIKRSLTAVLDAPSAADGSQLARLFRQELQSLLLLVGEWP